MNNLAAEQTERLYEQVILRHSRNPAHARRPARIDGSGLGDNPMCGDHVEVFLERDDAGGIADIGFEAQGCAISIASADLMAELLRGTDAGDARAAQAAFCRMINEGEEDPALGPLQALAGVHAYPSRRRCATLAWGALLDALGQRPGPAA